MNTSITPWQLPAEVFIKDLQARFGNLQRGGEAAYIEDLKQYTIIELYAGMEWLKENYTKTTFPRVAEILQAIAVAKPQKAYNENHKNTFPWAEREERAEQLLADFIKEFRLSLRFQEAVIEGWSDALLDYVGALAWVQAQALAGVRAMGWDSKKLLPPDAKGRSATELYAKYIKPKVDNALMENKIVITIPGALLNKWRPACA